MKKWSVLPYQTLMTDPQKMIYRYVHYIKNSPIMKVHSACTKDDRQLD